MNPLGRKEREGGRKGGASSLFAYQAGVEEFRRLEYTPKMAVREGSSWSDAPGPTSPNDAIECTLKRRGGGGRRRRRKGKEG
jgi:hypothetical protein